MIEEYISVDMERAALRELEPAWAHFDKLKFYDWCWEFLKRNPEFQKDWKEAHLIKKKMSEPEHIICKKTKRVVCDETQTEKFCSVNLIQTELIEKEQEADVSARKYGLASWPQAIYRYENPAQIYKPCGAIIDSSIGAKMGHSQGKAGSFRFHGVIPRLDENEDILIINYDVPMERYLEEVRRRYKGMAAQGRAIYKEPGNKQVNRDKSPPVYLFPEFLKVYDLYQWNEHNKKNKSSVWTSQNGLAAFAKKYIFTGPKKEHGQIENLVGNVKSHNKAAKEYILGTSKNPLPPKYKELFFYKKSDDDYEYDDMPRKRNDDGNLEKRTKYIDFLSAGGVVTYPRPDSKTDKSFQVGRKRKFNS